MSDGGESAADGQVLYSLGRSPAHLYRLTHPASPGLLILGQERPRQSRILQSDQLL